jgi:HD-like signal output (HDOD) protein
MAAQACASDCLNNPSNPSPETLIQRIFQSISEVSSFPAVALQITHLVEDPNTGSEDLLEVIRSDPALAMRLMRTVNSSYYTLRDKVADLKQAITLLGFRGIRSLALTACVSPLFQQTAGYRQYTRHGLWNHMVGTGMTARLIAKTCGKVRPEEAYLAGLLHDLGLILIDQYLHKRFCRIIDALTEETPFWEVERRILGFDHTALGQYVATKWNLQEHLTKAIGWHHWPDQYEGPHREMVSVVALADILCHLKKFPPLGIRNTQMPPVQLFIDLELGKQQVALIVAELDEVLGAADVMASAQLR